MTDVPTKVSAGRGHAESLAVRTLRVLEYLADNPSTAAEVARQIGVNRSTALRLLRDLEGAGYLLRDGAKTYAVAGHRFVPLAVGGTRDQDWIASITPTLTGVRDETGESTVAGVPAKDVMIYVAFFESRHTVAAREHLGTTRPMHASALGKAYLSRLSDEELETHLHDLPFEGGTDKAVNDPSALRSELRGVRKQGYATDRDETVEGLSCVAVPVVVGPTLYGACGISLPSTRVTRGKLQRFGETLVDEVARLA